MSKASAIPRSILIGLCLCLLVLNGLVFTTLFYLLDLPLIFLVPLFVLALGIIGLVAILSLLWQKPKAKIPSTVEKQIPVEPSKPTQAVVPKVEIQTVSDRSILSHTEKSSAQRASTSTYQKPIPIIATKSVPEPLSNHKLETVQPVSTKCPHGKKKEHCAICDRDSYEFLYGDWTTD